ncbi:hypothetical protein SAMD00019534_036060 [Acytostelium subglobosum LB1]|uniref:hypothetical protein n=1 Tax=Acytostelium subglobosum LB1 TaxID=1410327 RepID=UPI0006449B8C|nr:hypothetical protein SAMD00019534_036060 [Acytostelium subglobosum LB1]GAM20431.1 hypothetical protein SAMD00019534_036060 [Acytostelium subglobosum LB1]|eukprot:XP_012759952.1 hypothetical protein SAMD00019534_036060 [Acytostelium subglobosum LB1]
MSSDTNFLNKAIDIVKQATEQDEAKNYAEAYKLYMHSLDWFTTAMKYEKADKTKLMIKSRIMEYLMRAEQLKEHLEKNKVERKTKVSAGGARSSSPVNGAGAAAELDDDDRKRMDSLASSIVLEKPNVKWDDIAGLYEAKECLKEVVVFPIKCPHMFESGRQPWKGILLYGPPGTGKSFLAKAVATEISSTFFSISPSSIMNKYQGESERMVKQLFDVARAKGNSVIFIDEVDSLCSSRTDQESESSKRVKAEFLTQLEGVGNDTDGILILAATNFPWMLDIAIQRRFEKKIFIPHPDIHARAQMFQGHIERIPNSLSSEDYLKLAQMTEGYSGSDIRNACKDANMQPIRLVQRATHFKKIQAPSREDPAILAEYFTPCSPGDDEAIEMTWMDQEGSKLKEPFVTFNDCVRSLKNIKRSFNPKDLDKYLEFTREYGENGM